MLRRCFPLALLLALVVGAITPALAANTNAARPSVNGTLTSPRLVRRIEAKFPDQAKRAGIRKAEVHIQFKIDTNGRPLDVEIIDCSHKGVGFEAAAIRAVKRWRYEPALSEGKPVEVYQAVTLHFSVGEEGTSAAG
jgi:TonB family protein